MKALLKIAILGLAATYFVGCSASEDDDDDASTTTSTLASAFSDLSELPSVSSIVSSSVSSSGLGVAAVSGTPPAITSLKANADSYFWGGLVAQINNNEVTINSDLADRFFGQTDGGPGGHGACYMAQATGESLGRILSAGGSACYMKQIPTATSGVTITGATADEVFAQSSAQKHVQVEAATGEGTMYVNILVAGTDDVGSDVYQATLFFCDGTSSSSTIDSYEVINLNRSTGIYSLEMRRNSEGEVGTSSVSSSVRVSSDGSIEFDPTANRTATMHFGGSFGSFKGDLTVTSDSITAKRYFGWSQGSFSGSDKNYSFANYTGTGMSDLAFSQGAYKGENTFNDGSTTDEHSYQGATEWRDTMYTSVLSGTLYDSVSSVNFSTDTFYTDTTTPTVDLTNSGAHDCGATPDVTITMDFNDSAVQAIASTCDEQQFNDYDMCNQDSIQQAEQSLWQGVDFSN